MANDATGRPVPVEEPDDAIIDVWEVSPFMASDDYDSSVERSWQGMLEGVKNSLDSWLEGFTDEELREGVTLTIKVKSMSKRRYEEICEDAPNAH